jgi:hypothetical protein
VSRVIFFNLVSVFLVSLSACSVVAETKPITSFAECVAAGNPVLRSYPARCVTKDGFSFTDKADTSIPLLERPDDSLTPKKMCVDNCGDGSCDMIVCMAEGCPCAESESTCPKDCK